MDSIGRKHKWIKGFNIKTAKQLLQEQQDLPRQICCYPGCEVVLFHKGDYCYVHQIKVKKTKVED